MPTRLSLTGLANVFSTSAVSTDDRTGWARIPYGEWPHDQGLQRFGRAEADAMVGYFKNTWNRLKRAVIGMPIFRGHPDLPALAAQYPDRTVYGTIADLEARDDGLYLRPVLSAAGAALIEEQGLKFFSPHWLAQRLPDDAGCAVFAPSFLVSIGLTDRPNISGTSLVNAQPSVSTMPPWLPALLGLAVDTTEDLLRERLTALLAVPTALANETSARTAAESRLAAATAAHAATLVSHAIAAGRIAEADQSAWLERFSTDFAATSAALANERRATALKLAARTRDLGARLAAGPASDRFIALVNDRTARGESWESAWAAVKATAAGRALFEQMSAPSPQS